MNRLRVQRRVRLSGSLSPQAAIAATLPSALDIAEIRHFAIREPVSKRRYSLLRVTTKSRLIGWGECRYDQNSDFKALASAWVGRPASAYATIPDLTPFRAALDIAFLDILGKAANAPIYRVLGGPTRGKIRAYDALGTQEAPIKVIAVPAPASRNQGRTYQSRILELAKAVPSDQDFILAANGLLTPGDAASVARTLESKYPLWFDEPCSHANMEAIRKIADETVVPLAFGASIDDAGIFQELLREGLVDLVRPDIGVFGISGVKRIAALAEPYYVAVAPRHDGGPIGTAAAIQVAASIPNFFIQHVPVPVAEADRTMRREIASADLEVNKGGFLTLTNSPGLGVTVNEAALEKYNAS